MSSVEQLRETLAAKENELEENAALLAELEEMLAADPDDATLQGKRDLLAVIEETTTIANDLKAAIVRAEAETAPPPPPKWDPTKHPKFRNISSETPPPPPEDAFNANYNVKDVVMAKWSVDKGFYEATIVDKTGSAADPVYTVRFSYDDSKETKRRFEIRPMAGKKRKAEADPPANPAPIPAPVTMRSPDGATISKGPMLNASYVAEKPAHVPSQVKDGPTRMKPEKKKLKGSKVLEKKANSWQAFQQKGPGMKKPSQFKTPDTPTVSVVSSGRPMTKEQKPSRYTKLGYDRQEEEE